MFYVHRLILKTSAFLYKCQLSMVNVPLLGTSSMLLLICKNVFHFLHIERPESVLPAFDIFDFALSRLSASSVISQPRCLHPPVILSSACSWCRNATCSNTFIHFNRSKKINFQC